MLSAQASGYDPSPGDRGPSWMGKVQQAHLSLRQRRHGAAWALLVSCWKKDGKKSKHMVRTWRLWGVGWAVLCAVSL